MKICMDCPAEIHSRSKRCCSCEVRRRWKSGEGVRFTKGKRITAQGYVEIRVGGKYVREHRYVMEQHLERKLLPSETVHHINGNKLDNSLGNLELWSGVHPKGQRVKDLVEYARQILDTYGNDVLE